MRLAIERPRQPNLEAWFARLCERPAYRRIVDIALS
jgi:glutathione S-transferase